MGLLASLFTLVLIIVTYSEAYAAAPATTPPPLDAPLYDASHPETLVPEQLYARSAILIDQDTGRVLFEKDADKMMYPASTTKIMTVMLALEHGPLGETVKVPKEAGQLPELSSVMPVKPGEKILFDDLLYGLMMRSGNDAANAIAVLTAGSIPNFVARMNKRAEELGLTNTHFTSAHGYHKDDHYTTARDMAIITQAAMRNPRVREIAATTIHEVPKNNLRKNILTLKTTDRFLAGAGDEYSYPYGTGLKTGNTGKAGKCFVGTAEKDGVNLICVVFFSTSKNEVARFMDAAKLMDYGFAQYRRFSFAELYERAPLTVRVEGYAPDDPRGGQLKLQMVMSDEAGAFSICGLKDDGDNLALSFMSGLDVTYTSDLQAPIREGDVIGNAHILPQGGGQSLEVMLVASRDIEARPTATPEPEIVARPTENPAQIDDIDHTDVHTATNHPPAGWTQLIVPVVVVVVAFTGVLIISANIARARRAATRRRRRAKRRPKGR